MALFAEITSREIIMDITNYESDDKAGIQTIPVKYWTVMVVNVALGWSLLSGVAVGGSLSSAFARWDTARSASSGSCGALESRRRA